MSFGKLLAAGKSVVGSKDSFCYRANPSVFLPKFISPKNPFVQSPNKDASASAVIPAVPATSLPNQAADAGARAAKPGSFQKAAARASVWKGIAKKFASTSWLILKKLLARLNPVTLLRRPVVAAKSAIPRFGKPAVQSEFSLDRVRVVRNDLSDADLEVVAAGRAPVEKQRPDEGAWDRLATRVFGTETT